MNNEHVSKTMNKKTLLILVLGVGIATAGVGGFWLTANSSEAHTVGMQAPPPSMATMIPVAGRTRLQVERAGTASFLIDAPLEKIKGTSTGFAGNLDVDWKNLSATTGQISLDIDTLKTMTFGEAGKDSTQTEHAHNWLGLGSDAKDHTANQMARFTIRSVRAPGLSADTRSVEVDAEGDLWVHGITAKKTVRLKIEVMGPKDSPSSVHVTTLEPLRVSLSEHDVKPRDVAGKFLSGALEKVGKKIDDSVQVSLDFTATQATEVSAR
jgi:polyisoprenoid-binding protein YceI